MYLFNIFYFLRGGPQPTLLDVFIIGKYGNHLRTNQGLRDFFSQLINIQNTWALPPELQPVQ